MGFAINMLTKVNRRRSLVHKDKNNLSLFKFNSDSPKP